MAAITTTEDIVQNADYHARLLREHSDLEYTPTAQQQHKSYVKDLETQLAASDKKIEELTKVTKKERKEHERLRDSTARKFAAKISGKKEKFEANQVKEEREYVEALQNEMAERDNNAMLQQLLAEAQAVADELKTKGKRHEQVQKEIESLYSRVFDGPSDSFPEEDRLEYDVHEAHKAHQKAQEEVNMQSQSAELLARAVVHMDRCFASVKEALSYSTYDMWGGGGMADMMERNALTNATAQARQSENLVEQARRINPLIQPVGHVNIASGSLMSDVFFDNIFTDMAFHEKIKKSAAQVLIANNRLKQERDAASRRADIAGKHLVQASQRLDDRRKELFYLRKALFESVASSAPRPPSYENVMDDTMPVPTVRSMPEAATNPATTSQAPVTYAPPPGPPPSVAPSVSKESAPAASPGYYAPPSGPPPSNPANTIPGTSGTHSPPSGPPPGAQQQGAQAPSFSLPPHSGVGATTDGPHAGGSTDPAPGSPPPSPRVWGTRNPYAAFLRERSRSMSKSDQTNQ